MRIPNPRIDAISSALLLVLFASLLVHMPFSAWYKNPPYHYYGGFDMRYWGEGWIIFGSQFLATLLIRRTRYANRRILSVVIAMQIVCLLLNLGTFLVAHGEPTL